MSAKGRWVLIQRSKG